MNYTVRNQRKPAVKMQLPHGESSRVSENKAQIEKCAIRVFLEKDCTKVTFSDLEAVSGVKKAVVSNYYRSSKDPIIVNAAKLLVQAQSDILKEELADKAQNALLYCASMIALHIYMSDKNENIKTLYETAYLLPDSQKFLYCLLTDRAKGIGTRNSAEYQIASIGILREMIATPTNHYMPTKDKIRHTVRMTLELYDAGREDVERTLAFVSGLNLESLTEKVLAKVVE